MFRVFRGVSGVAKIVQNESSIWTLVCEREMRVFTLPERSFSTVAKSM